MQVERLGKFELVRRLATGGMAHVYLARVSGLAGFERHVVLKILRPQGDTEAPYVAMFLDEARLAATLHHQHVAQVFDVGCEAGTYYLAMEYVHGETVDAVLGKARLRGARLPLDFSLSVICAAAAGLHHAHERRGADGALLHIVHRDVSPSNVILSYDGSIKLIDFGIAKADARETHTQPGLIKGKAGYMAPEQARGYPVDRRSDVFALGVLAYELTTQQRAFEGASDFELTEKLLRGDVVRPGLQIDGYPAELEAAVMTALELDADDRFQDADELRRAFEQIARGMGLVLGGAPVMRCLEELFGPRVEPWLPARPMTIDRPATVDQRPLFEVPRPPTAYGFARGSGAQDSLDALDALDALEDTGARTRPIDADELLPTSEFELLLEPDLRTPLPAAHATLDLRAPATGSGLRPPLVVAPPSPTQQLPAPSTVDLRASASGSGLRSALVVAPPSFAPAFASSPQIFPSSPQLRQPARTRAVSRVTSRGVAAIVVAGLSLGLVSGLAIVALRQRPQPVQVAVVPPATAAPARAAAARPAPVRAPEPAPVIAIAPAEVTLHITTEPPGATVVLDGVRLGTTPYAGRVPATAKTAWLKVRMRDHRAVKTKITLDRADVTWSVRLRRLAR